MDSILINGLKIFAYHGVNPEEKENGQYFIFDIILKVDLSAPCYSDNVADTVSYSTVTKTVVRVFTEQSYDLIERAAQRVCDEILATFPAVQEVDLTLKKPEAPVKADFDCMAVHLCRCQNENCEHTFENRTAILSLGSNLGDREGNIKNAISAINNLPHTCVTRTSGAYFTKPFGVDSSHPDYLNCCVEISTVLSPHALLGGLLGIEAALGRIRRDGQVLPRTIDIDLLLYRNIHICDKELCLPHPRMDKRAFVLVPLSDLYPHCRSDWFDYSASLQSVGCKGVVPADISL